MTSAADIATILLMAAVTFGTRIGGYLLLRNRVMSLRATAVLETAPGCILIAVIAPRFVSSRPADLLALTITVVAAMRLPMLATVVVAVTADGLLRQALG